MKPGIPAPSISSTSLNGLSSTEEKQAERPSSPTPTTTASSAQRRSMESLTSAKLRNAWQLKNQNLGKSQKNLMDEPMSPLEGPQNRDISEQGEKFDPNPENGQQKTDNNQPPNPKVNGQDDENPLIELDTDNPNPPVGEHTAQLHTAVSEALDSAKNNLLIDDKLRQDIRDFKANLGNPSDPKQAEDEARAAHSLLEQVDAFGGQSLAGPLDAAIQKHANDTTQKTDDIVPPHKDDEYKPGTLAAQVAELMREISLEITETAPVVGANDTPATAQAAVTKGLGTMLASEALNEALSEKDKADINAHLERLNRNGGPEPTAEEIADALACQQKMTQVLANEALKGFDEIVNDPRLSQEDKDWLRKELAAEHGHMKAIAEGKPIYQRPSDPPPKQTNKPASSSNQTPTSDASKTEEKSKKEAYEKQEKMMLEAHEMQQRLDELEMFLRILKKGRKFILDYLI